MKLKLALIAITLATSAAHGLTIDTDVYFAFARDRNGGKVSVALSNHTCKAKPMTPGKWKKAAIYIDTGDGFRTLDGCWIKDKQPDDNYGRSIDLKICGIIDGALSTPCRTDAFSSFISTDDLPKAPSRAQF